jgi:pimeloyl-ACP methyl ester carboxylesterase
MSSRTNRLATAPSRQQRCRVGVIAACIILLILLLLAPTLRIHLRAAGILLRVQDPKSSGLLATFDTYHIDESLMQITTPAGAIRARLYVPRGLSNAPGMVIVHGLHRLGIDEPRLMALARAVSTSGIRVLTPELPALADYQIDAHSIALIGYSARNLSSELRRKVGVLGVSFGGGLSLLAAADSHYEPYIGFVLSVGGHDDLERVSEFLITNTIHRPDGTTLRMAAHEYGRLVLIYSQIQDFFPRSDLEVARKALRLLLWEQVSDSKKEALLLSPASRQKMDLLYGHDVQAFDSEIKQVAIRHEAEMSAASPHGRLRSLQVPVLLLHGAADNVIPPSELLWLQQEIPPKALKDALISPALSHVSFEGEPTAWDQLHLIHFMAEVLALADSEGHSHPAPISSATITP